MLPNLSPTRVASKRCRIRQRRGNMMVLMTTVLIAILAVAGLTINMAQLTVARTELRMATDAAAKAATVVLGQTQSTEASRLAAVQMANRFTVSGSAMNLDASAIEFGNASRTGLSTYSFVANAEPINSVRIDAAIGEGEATGPIQFFMTSFLDTEAFSVEHQSIASRIDHDICLVVDRSGSMAWDLSNEEWSYPEDDDGSIMQNYFQPPHPTLSRWAALSRACAVFIEQLEELPYEIQLGMSSFSSNFTFGVYESTASTRESGLTLNYSDISDALASIAEEPIIGNTNIASGMQIGVEVLTSDEARITAKATMVVLTDGIWTQGTNPVEVAAAAAAANITVHTITFSDQADQVLMAQVAQAGGGNHYHAPTEEALNDAFRQIAETLPSVLVK